MSQPQTQYVGDKPVRARTQVLNLDADSMVPTVWPYWRRCCPPDQQPTTRIDGGDRGLSNKPLFATNAKE